MVSHGGVCAGTTGFDCLFSPLSACALPQLLCGESVVSMESPTYNVLRMLNPQLDDDRGEPRVLPGAVSFVERGYEV